MKQDINQAQAIDQGQPINQDSSKTESLFAYTEGKRLVWMMGISALVLFFCSSVRHGLFQSSAFDLGTFDQAVYLISQGKTPFSSLMEFHILADHASFILYPIAVLYWIYPTVHWLFVVQSMSLASGAIPTWYLSRQAGLSPALSLAMGVAYLLYPLVFNVNVLDFHPDVVALPAFLWAVFFAREKRLGWFCLAIAVILSCKESFGLAVAAMGVWFFLEKRFRFGAIALSTGILWFLFATKVVIPHFGTDSAEIGRQLLFFDHLGGSFSEIALNLLNPIFLVSHIFTTKNLYYVFLLILPLAWGMHWRYMLPLVAAIPHLSINLLSKLGVMKNLFYWYSIPVLPFLILTAIATLAAGKGLLKTKRAIIVWSIVTFMVMSKVLYFWLNYTEELDTWQAIRTAIPQVPPEVSLLTDHKIAPHLTHRPRVRLAQHVTQNFDLATLPEFEAVLLNARQPRGRKPASEELMDNILSNLQANPQFHLQFMQDDIYLFLRK